MFEEGQLDSILAEICKAAESKADVMNSTQKVDLKFQVRVYQALPGREKGQEASKVQKVGKCENSNKKSQNKPAQSIIKEARSLK